MDNLSFKELVRKVHQNDEYFNIIVTKYFMEDLKLNEEEAKKSFSRLIKYNDVYNDFTKYLTMKKFDFKDALEVRGMSAMKIHQMNPNLNGLEVYLKLCDYKEGIQIGIIRRTNTGKVVKGATFMTALWFELNGSDGKTTSRETVYGDEDYTGANFSTTMVFKMADDDKKKLDELVSRTHSKYSSKSEQVKNVLNMVSLYINDKLYTLDSSKDEDSKILSEFSDLIKVNEVSRITRGHFIEKEENLKKRVNLFLSRGLDVKEIAKMMNLTLDEVDKLRN